MNLEDFIDEPKVNKDEIKSKIRQRRSQMLVHSRLYYEMDTNIVDDDTWQRWANELRDIQRQHPDCCRIDFFDRDFANWNGDTGMHLPLKNDYVVNKTQQVLSAFEKFERS